MVLAGDGVVEDAIAEGAERGEADGEFVGEERAGDRGAGLDEIVGAVGEFAVRFPIEGRFPGRDDDGAGGGVLAEERALRAAQHGDLVDVGKVEGGGGGAAVPDAIDIEADAGFEAVIGLADGDDAAAEAADGEAGVARVGRAVVEGGDEQGELPGVDGVAGVEKAAGDGGQRDGDALGGFVAQAGGDDDFGEAVGVRGLASGSFGGGGERDQQQ